MLVVGPSSCAQKPGLPPTPRTQIRRTPSECLTQRTIGNYIHDMVLQLRMPILCHIDPESFYLNQEDDSFEPMSEEVLDLAEKLWQEFDTGINNLVEDTDASSNVAIDFQRFVPYAEQVTSDKLMPFVEDRYQYSRSNIAKKRAAERVGFTLPGE